MVGVGADRLLTLLAQHGLPQSASPLWAEDAPPKLTPDLSLGVISSLIVIVVLGVFLLVVISFGARITRRNASKRFPPMQVDEDEWFRKPLVDEAADEPTHDSE